MYEYRVVAVDGLTEKSYEEGAEVVQTALNENVLDGWDFVCQSPADYEGTLDAMFLTFRRALESVN